MARPREFDEEEIMKRVLDVFWRQGYEGTSLKDLMKVTSLTKSSIYAAFNSKADLFRRAGELYSEKFLGFHAEAFAETSPRRVAEAILYGTADLHTSTNSPSGCFETNGALACSAESEDIRQEIVYNRLQMREKMRRRFEELRDVGPVLGNDCDKAANFVSTIIQGMAVQAKAGATREELHDFLDLAMRAWPEF